MQLPRLLAAACFSVLIWTLLASPVLEAWNPSPGNLRNLSRYGDEFYNYDFEHERVVESEVDWPVNLLFTDRATRERVWDMYAYYPGMGWSGSAMYLQLNDGGGYVWDSTGGQKFEAPVTEHYRAYAAAYNGDVGGWASYNLTWGYYVVATSHKDSWETMPWGYSGYSEFAEGRFGEWAEWAGYEVLWEDEWAENPEPPRTERTWWGFRHIWDNWGGASRVRMP